jgi:hypothetical protein
LYPRNPNAPPTAANRATAATAKKPPNESLISKFQLQDRISESTDLTSEHEFGGKAQWEESAEKREASLRERKAKMILAARQYVLGYVSEMTEHETLTLGMIGECWRLNKNLSRDDFLYDFSPYQC